MKSNWIPYTARKAYFLLNTDNCWNPRKEKKKRVHVTVTLNKLQGRSLPQHCSPTTTLGDQGSNLPFWPRIAVFLELLLSLRKQQSNIYEVSLQRFLNIFSFWEEIKKQNTHLQNWYFFLYLFFLLNPNIGVHAIIFGVFCLFAFCC